MAVLLAASNSAFSAHVSNHPVSDTGLCSLCVHPGGPDTAIAHEVKAVFASVTDTAETRVHTKTRITRQTLCSHQSRAPPQYS